MVRCTWSASFLRCSRSPIAITKFGIKVVTATYYSSDCENSLYYRTSRDQPYKLLYQLMSSALFRKVWCIHFHPVRSYWHFFISHNLKIQDGGSWHILYFEVVNLTIPACRQCEIWDLYQICFDLLSSVLHWPLNNVDINLFQCEELCSKNCIITASKTLMIWSMFC